LATGKLSMRPVTPGITQYVTMVGGDPAANVAPKQEEKP
jgi:hypothetical protein